MTGLTYEPRQAAESPGRRLTAIVPQTDPAEREARSAADAVVRGETARVGAVPRPAGPAALPPGPGRTGGLLLPEALRAGYEAPFGHDFGRVRLRTDAEDARAMGARAYTLGNEIAFAPGRYSPSTADGRRLLAHELAHVAQQSGRGPVLQADVDDPARFQQVHENLFVNAPGGGGKPATWRPTRSSDPGSAGEIEKEFIDALKDLIKKNPMSVGGVVPTETTEADADAGAIAVDREIHKRFPMIPTQVSDADLKSRVSVIKDSQTSEDAFLKQWLGNRLSLMTSIDKFGLAQADARIQGVLTDLLADKFAGPNIRILASRIGAFTEGDAGTRKVFLNRGLPDALRHPVLIHELIHFYVSAEFRSWIAGANSPEMYTEGFTEYLARLVMTPDEAKKKNSYARAVAEVTSSVAAHVPDDDIARAYFLGEVWRLEASSAVSQQLFEQQVGIRSKVSLAEEGRESQAGPGIVETVASGARYRFMNLGNEQPDPKPEHVDAFRQIYAEFVVGHSDARLRFVGHASTPGTRSFNDALSRRRSAAFYQLARDTGVPDAQLLDAKDPPHQGEMLPTEKEGDAHARAFNRRVELFLTSTTPPAVPAKTAGEEER